MKSCLHVGGGRRLPVPVDVDAKACSHQSRTIHVTGSSDVSVAGGLPQAPPHVSRGQHRRGGLGNAQQAGECALRRATWGLAEGQQAA